MKQERAPATIEPATKWDRVEAAKAGDKRWCVRCGGYRAPRALTY